MLAQLVPHALVVVTEIEPLELPPVTEIEFDVPPAVCAQPLGNVQLYVFPETLVTEYEFPVELAQILDEPVIEDGAEGTEFIAIVAEPYPLLQQPDVVFLDLI